MTLFTHCVDIVEKVIKQQTLTYSFLPVVATLVDSTGINITNTLFGISSLSLDAPYWGITGNTVKNIIDIEFGEALTDYASDLYLKLVGNDGTVLTTGLLDFVIETGSELTLFADTGINFTFSFGTPAFSNALLNLIFKGINNFPITSFSAKYFDNANTLQATISLTSTKWSNRYVGNLGEIFFEYGNTQTLPSIDSTIKLARITDSANTVWFEFPISIPTNLKPNAIIYSNSLVLRVSNPDVNLSTYVAPSNLNSIFHVDFNGGITEKSFNRRVSSFTDVTYDAEKKLFGTECLVAGSDTEIVYSGVVFPNEFTLNAFFRFDTSVVGRSIVFAEKVGVFRLAKNSAGNLEVSINGAVVISTAWTPALNQWQHLWVQKSNTELKLRVNSADVNVTQSYSTIIATNNNSFSACIGVRGLCNGISIESGSASPFTLNTQPHPKNRYNWADISFYSFINSGLLQLQQYFQN